MSELRRCDRCLSIIDPCNDEYEEIVTRPMNPVFDGQYEEYHLDLCRLCSARLWRFINEESPEGDEEKEEEKVEE